MLPAPEPLPGTVLDTEAVDHPPERPEPPRVGHAGFLPPTTAVRPGTHRHPHPRPVRRARLCGVAVGFYVAERLGTQGKVLAGGVKSGFVDGLSASLFAVRAVVLATAIGCLFRAPKAPSAAD
jgi:hypothetical protein